MLNSTKNWYKIILCKYMRGGKQMKKLKLTKLISSALIAVSVVALNPIGVNAEWKSNSSGWWYTEGSGWATGWRLIDKN